MTFWEEAVSFVLCPKSLASPQSGHCQVSPRQGGAAACTRVSCHQVTVAQRAAQCRSQQEDVQLKGQKYPKEINAGLINIRPVDDNCQQLGNKGPVSA